MNKEIYDKTVIISKRINSILARYLFLHTFSLEYIIYITLEFRIVLTLRVLRDEFETLWLAQRMRNPVARRRHEKSSRNADGPLDITPVPGNTP